MPKEKDFSWKVHIAHVIISMRNSLTVMQKPKERKETHHCQRSFPKSVWNKKVSQCIWCASIVAEGMTSKLTEYAHCIVKWKLLLSLVYKKDTFSSRIKQFSAERFLWLFDEIVSVSTPCDNSFATEIFFRAYIRFPLTFFWIFVLFHFKREIFYLIT